MGPEKRQLVSLKITVVRVVTVDNVDDAVNQH